MTNMKVNFNSAVQMVKASKPVVIPTETVYGMAASMDDEEAITEIYRLKNRPRNKPLAIAVSSVDQIISLTSSLPPFADALIDAFLPGPLTLVLPANLNRVPTSIRGDKTTVAIRLPDHPIALDLINECGPLALTSANISGQPSAVSAHDIVFDHIDDGPTKWELESTILEYFDGVWNIHRKGAISEQQIIEKMREHRCDKPLLYASNAGQQ